MAERFGTAEWKMEFDASSLTARIHISGSKETYWLNLPERASVRVGDAHGAWLHAGKKPEELKRFPMAPQFLKSAKRMGDLLRLAFDFDGLEVVADCGAGDHGALAFTVHPTTHPSHAVAEAVFPGFLSLEKGTPYSVVFPRAQGLLFEPGDRPYEYSSRVSGQGMTMRWFGGLGESSAYLCIAEEPEDGWFDLRYAPSAEFSTALRWTASLGTLRYARKLLYRFVPESSYLILAEQFRAYAERRGLVVSLREKMEKCPSLDRLWGGVLFMLGYYQDPHADYVGQMKKIRQMGIDRGMVYPVHMPVFHRKDADDPENFAHLPSDQIRQIREMGYLTGCFFCPLDIWSSHPFAEVIGARRDPADPNHLLLSWQIGNQKMYRTHPGKVLQVLDTEFDFSEVEDVHFDVLGNAAGGDEDYSPEWPLTRAGHLRECIGLAEYFIRRGKVVSCEGKTDSLVAHIHWGSFRQPVVPIYTPLHPPAQAAKPWPPVHPVPLWQLVFHDAIFHSAWEHHTYNDGCGSGTSDPQLCYLHDLLYGDLPSVFPMGRLYRYIGQDKQVEYYSIDFNAPVVQQSLALAKKAATHHREVGMSRMISHRFLDEARLVQETVFEHNTRVVVNFTEKPFFAEGRMIPARDAIVQPKE